VTQLKTQKRLEAALDLYQVGLAADGDVQAFDLLYRRWHPKLLRLALRLTGHTEEARDVMQDAALTIAKDIHKLRDHAQFSSWAYTIIRRRAADHIDRAVRRRASNERITPTDLNPDPDEDLALRQALSQLPETERLMLTLFYVDGLKGTEMAAALGIPLGTLKSRLYTARKKLKDLYETTEGEKS